MVLGPIGEELLREGIDIFKMPLHGDGRLDYLASLEYRRVFRERQIDVLHTHTTHALVDAALCKLMRPSVKVIHTFHFSN